MEQEIEYLEVKFALGSITLIVGFIGASIALFQWVERTGVQYLLGDYSRYVLGFGGFAAMIFGAMLINDAWILSNVMKGKYGLPTNYTTAKPSGTYVLARKRIIRTIPKVSGLKEKRRRKSTRRKTS